MGFSDDIHKFTIKCVSNSDEVVEKTVKDVLTSIMDMSPVGDPDRWQNPDNKPDGYVGGHFRANWQLGIGSLPAGVVDGVDKEGDMTLAKAYAVIPPHAAGPVYYFGNNLPYAIPLEEGHSKIAPNGMVGLTAVRFNGFVKNALAELK